VAGMSAGSGGTADCDQRAEARSRGRRMMKVGKHDFGFMVVLSAELTRLALREHVQTCTTPIAVDHEKNTRSLDFARDDNAVVQCPNLGARYSIIFALNESA